MNILGLDTETPKFDKKEIWRGNPYGDKRGIVCWSAATQDKKGEAWLWTDESASVVQVNINCADLIVFFNGKHDVSWLRKHGVDFSRAKVWDVQLGEFVLSRQTHKFPSLDETCIKYGHPTKVDLIKEEFWESKCSCHVSIVERLLNIFQSNSALNAIVKITNNGTDLDAMSKHGSGEKIIQSVMKLIKSDELKQLLLILKLRLESVCSKNATDMEFQKLNMFNTWNNQFVKYVESLSHNYASITTIKPERLEECCVLHVMQLWDMLRNQNGWREHSHTCAPQSIDTADVPQEILLPYSAGDPELTLKCYYSQIKLLTPAQRVLVSLMSQDMLILQEMEQNGIPYNHNVCAERASSLDEQISSLKEQLSKIYPSIPINFGSGDHLSAFLYGGTIKEEYKEHIGFYKTGIKAGEPKYKNSIKEHILPQLFKPLENTELKKEGFYETNEGTLKKLKGKNKPILDKLLQLSKLEKLNGTYYKGLPKLNAEMQWPLGMLHGQFNQCLAGTGRLSSSKPNQQNFANEIQDIFVSRYE